MVVEDRSNTDTEVESDSSNSEGEPTSRLGHATSRCKVVPPKCGVIEKGATAVVDEGNQSRASMVTELGPTDAIASNS
ncbi:unnamed protein product [Dovyalis caffra]|uniref:Uncharacterized protein n=1 Tax=Dovyalis caffra TaxID=77055 RepID=A0AAV1RNT9_9ROSI|nr:unnamed protein product [Dovyalis caffra]